MVMLLLPLLLMMMMMVVEVEVVVVTTVIITMSLPRLVERKGHLFVQHVLWCSFTILFPTLQISGASKAK